MTPRKLNVAIVGFPYGGNGSVSHIVPAVKDWTVSTVLAMKKDDRVGEIFHRDFSDCPITATRNESIEWAKKIGVDVLIMVDSDMTPDLYVGVDPLAKPFFASSFDKLYKHYDQGPIAIVAPYCGPPGHPRTGGWENVYVFKWQNMHSDEPQREEYKLDPFERDEASRLTGFTEVAAGPTGLCMIDMRVFQYMTHPYFYYQYEGDGELCPTCHQHKPGPQAQKSTTEDVAFFRDMNIAVQDAKGYAPVLCNWDAWAGHNKPKCVGKPTAMMNSQVAKKMRDAFERSPDRGMRSIQLGESPKLGDAPLARQPQAVETEKTAELPDRAVLVEKHGKVYASPEMNPTSNMDAQDQEALRGIVVSYCRGVSLENRTVRIVEVGSWIGHSACIMAEAASILTDYEMHCVDHWQGGIAVQRQAAEQHDVFERWKQNTARFAPFVFAHRGDSTQVAIKDWAHRDKDHQGIDILFIDADHSYESCLADIKAWAPFVKPGGIIMGHDYSFVFPGVKRAVHEVFGWDIPTAGSSIWIERLPRELNPKLKEIVSVLEPHHVDNPVVFESDTTSAVVSADLSKRWAVDPVLCISETEVARNGQE